MFGSWVKLYFLQFLISSVEYNRWSWLQKLLISQLLITFNRVITRGRFRKLENGSLFPCTGGNSQMEVYLVQAHTPTTYRPYYYTGCYMGSLFPFIISSILKLCWWFVDVHYLLSLLFHACAGLRTTIKPRCNYFNAVQKRAVINFLKFKLTRVIKPAPQWRA